MTIHQRIQAFGKLGIYLNEFLVEEKYQQERDVLCRQAFVKNGWFDEKQVVQSLKEIASMLALEKLDAFVANYEFKKELEAKTVGVIMAGNIPAVGFHDFLCVLLSGAHILIKPSSKDEELIRFISKALISLESEFQNKIAFSKDYLKGIDAIIATGSNNSSKYFEYYFSKIPHIIRKNRTSVAIISGNETKQELLELGADIFTYYGLGCRNVTKLFVPKGYKVDHFYEGIVDFGWVLESHKYTNNYDYHKSVYLLNQDKIWDNNFLILKEDTGWVSPVGALFYEEYTDEKEVKSILEENQEGIQCIVGKGNLEFGQAQKPQLTDFADNVDTMQFLKQL